MPFTNQAQWPHAKNVPKCCSPFHIQPNDGFLCGRNPLSALCNDAKLDRALIKENSWLLDCQRGDERQTSWLVSQGCDSESERTRATRLALRDAMKRREGNQWWDSPLDLLVSCATWKGIIEKRAERKRHTARKKKNLKKIKKSRK